MGYLLLLLPGIRVELGNNKPLALVLLLCNHHLPVTRGQTFVELSDGFLLLRNGFLVLFDNHHLICKCNLVVTHRLVDLVNRGLDFFRLALSDVLQMRKAFLGGHGALDFLSNLKRQLDDSLGLLVVCGVGGSGDLMEFVCVLDRWH